jgi:hypothetical protein
MILELLEARGIQPGSRAFRVMESLVELEPSKAFMHQSFELVRDLGNKSDGGSEIVDLCTRVAKASGGLLGFGDPVSAAERAQIQSVAEALGAEAQARSKQLS